jgi:hypothetical protein
VVGAKLTPSKRELLVLCRTAPHPEDSTALSTLTATTISLSSMKASVPRIDLPDVSHGTTAPAFDISSPLVTTGSEYLLADLGCGVVGVFSLATGQLVREMRLHSMQPGGGVSGTAAAAGVITLGGLQWMHVKGSRRGQGKGAPAAGGQRTLLAAAAVSGQHVCLVQMDTAVAAQEVRAAQEQQQQRQKQRQQQQQVLLQHQQQQRDGAMAAQQHAGPRQQQQQRSQQQPVVWGQNNQQPQLQQQQMVSSLQQQRQQQVDQQGSQRPGKQGAPPVILKSPQSIAGRKSSVRFQNSSQQALDSG